MKLIKSLLLFSLLMLTSNVTAQKFDEIHKIKPRGIDSIGDFYLFHFKDYRKIESTVRIRKDDGRVNRLIKAILKKKKIPIKLVKIHSSELDDGLVLASNRALIGDIYYLDGKFQMPFIDSKDTFNYKVSKFVYGVEFESPSN